jgi:hypothetical protein
VARKNVIEVFEFFDSVDLSQSHTSESTNVKNLDKASIRIAWTGASATPGTIKVQARQEKQNIPESNAQWFDLDLGSTLNIDNTDTNHQIIFSDLPFVEIRLVYTTALGASGTMSAKITAKQVGG